LSGLKHFAGIEISNKMVSFSTIPTELCSSYLDFLSQLGSNLARGQVFCQKRKFGIRQCYYGLVVRDNKIPICPISSYIRTKTFAVNEWNRYFGEDFIVVDKTWTSLIRGGQALVNAEKCYLFFSSSSFDSEYMMDGDNRAYYLVYAAILACV
jgi:hypothetical protein